MAYSKEKIEERFTEICRQISEEGKSLRKILLSKDMPTAETFYKWIDADENKTKQYVRATTARADVIFEEILEIADNPQQGESTTESENGIFVTTSDMIQHRRLQVDSRKWMLGKMNPKKYSDKIQVDTTEFSEQPLFPDVPKNDSNK